jgi:hypothetical protein
LLPLFSVGSYAREWGGAHYHQLDPGDMLPLSCVGGDERAWGEAHLYRLKPGDLLPLFCVGGDAGEWGGAHYFWLGPGDLVLEFFDLGFFDLSGSRLFACRGLWEVAADTLARVSAGR